jgi:hypothetical protein
MVLAMMVWFGLVWFGLVEAWCFGVLRLDQSGCFELLAVHCA